MNARWTEAQITDGTLLEWFVTNLPENCAAAFVYITADGSLVSISSLSPQDRIAALRAAANCEEKKLIESN